MIINKQLKSIPFDKLYHMYEEAAASAIAGIESHIQSKYDAEVERLEQAYTDTHEAPSEVGFGDQVVRETYNAHEVRRRAGNKAITDTWIPRYKLGSLLIAVMPQIMAYITQKPFRLSEVSTVEGKWINGKTMLKNSFDFTSDWDRGLYCFLMLDSRSAYLPTQYKGEGRQFCSLVPLIPYAYKLHHKINYSQWDRNTLHWVVNPSLCNAMLYIPDKAYTREELIHARELGLVYQTGAKAGESRNPVSTFKLWATKGGCMSGVPDLAQVMYTQIWCAHPQNRSHYMVLDPKHWDTMPTPLISENIFMPPEIKVSQPQFTGLELPWEV